MSLISSRRLLVLSIIALTLCMTAVAKRAMAQDMSFEPLREATITVTGRGSVNAEPDIAIVTAGAVTEAQTVGAALDSNAKIMNDALAALRALGIEERDMRTSRLSVEPRYTYFDSSNGERRPPRIDGYTVSNQLTVRVRELTMIDEAFDALITAGVNQIGGLSFAIDEPDALYDQARRDAVADASAQAALLAEAAGVTLGRIVSIAPGQARQQPPMPQMARMAAAMEADTVPIATGEQELTATVTIMWALNE